MSHWPDLINDARAVAVTTLGIPFVYIDENGVETQVAAGIFFNDFVAEPLGDGPGMTNAAPMLGVSLSDLPVDPADDQGEVVVKGVRYYVREVQKDGQGGARLVLEIDR